MEALLWPLQVVLALFSFAYGVIALRPSPATTESIGTFSRAVLGVVGLVLVLATAGLLVPEITGYRPDLTPVSAVAVGAVALGGAVVETRRRNARKVLTNAVFLALAVAVAVGRWELLG